jgi:enhancer of polycomb-like protein
MNSYIYTYIYTHYFLHYFLRLHFRPKTPPASEHSPSEESSDSDSEVETTTIIEPLSYPFPPEATSVCVDIESDRLDDDDPPFTSEFNISDYFSIDTLSDFDLALAASSSRSSSDNSDWRTEELGCSRFLVLPEVGNLFAPQIRPQCSGSANSVNISNYSTTSPMLCTNIQSTVSNTSMTTQRINVNIETQLNNQVKYRQLQNNSNATSILSKSLTSPSNNRSCTGGIRVFGTMGMSGSGSTITNFGNGHKNGPVTQIHNTKSIPNSTHIVNNQSTILLPQKHTSNLLPGFSKFANLARHQQQIHDQTQQIPTSGEIMLNSNR